MEFLSPFAGSESIFRKAAFGKHKMIEIILKIIEAIAKYALGVFAVCLFVIILPENTAKSIGLETIKMEHLGYWWLGLIFSGAIWVSSIIPKLGKWYSGYRAKVSLMKAVIRRLYTLDSIEKEWIRYCLLENVQTLNAPQINPTANSLVDKGVLSQGTGDILSLPFHINDFVWEYLQNHKDDFLLPSLIEDNEFVRNLKEFPKSLYY